MRQKLKEGVYLDERNSLIEEERQQSRLYDRGVLTLTAGAFGLTFLLLQSLDCPKHLWVLALGWLGFGLSLLFTMISFLTSQESYRRQVEILDECQQAENNQEVDENNSWETSTNWLNWSSLICFIAGIFSLAGFAFINYR